MRFVPPVASTLQTSGLAVFPSITARPLFPATHGLGGTAEVAVSAGGQVAMTATTTAATAGAIAVSWVPVVGAAVAAVTIALAWYKKRNAQKTAATRMVDDLEPQLAANRDGFLNGPRTRSSQTIALRNFDDAWEMLEAKLSDPSLGAAGRRAIEERGRDGRPAWGSNWFELYRDPIEAAAVTADPLADSISSLFPGASESEMRLAKYAAAAALIALAVYL